MSHSIVDVAIVGGAVMGSSIAWHLSREPQFTGSLLVIEKDPSYQACASALSAASIRQQFSTAINIDISLYGIDFLREIGMHLSVNGEQPTVDLHEGGYLFLAPTEKRGLLEANHALQTQMGADILFLDQKDLERRFPWLNTEDLSAGCWGASGEGWFDGYGLMQAFRRAARGNDVPYLSGEVVKAERKGDVFHLTLANGDTIDCAALVNAAGASGATRLAAHLGVDLPIVSKKRMIFTFDCRDAVPGCPLLIDPSGTYVRPEGTGFLCGSAPHETQDPDTDDFDVDHAFFEDHLWPTLAHRVPAFEAIKPGVAWAGHYDMNLFDHNAVVGSVDAVPGFYLCAGFSGHGLQQAPAIGRGLAELIIHGDYRALDLSELAFARIAENRPILERNVV